MKKIWQKYGGVILFYSVVIGGIFILNARVRYLNQLNLEKNNSIVAMGD